MRSPDSRSTAAVVDRDEARGLVRASLERGSVELSAVEDLATLAEESVWVPLTRTEASVTIDYGGQQRNVATPTLPAAREEEYWRRLARQTERFLAASPTLEADLGFLREILARKLTMVSLLRLLELLLACREAPSGTFVECGIAGGGCLAVMKWVGRGLRRVWGFDSFEGMPALGPEDQGEGSSWIGHRCGPAGGADQVRRDIGAMTSTDGGLTIVPGWVEQTLPRHVAEIGSIAVLRLDVDWFAATTTCLELLCDHVVPGGVVIIDDYGAFAGCRDAVDRYRRLRGIDATLVWEDHDAAHWRIPADGESF